MATPRRKFSDAEKRTVLQLAEENGVTNILKNYNLSYTVFARWKKKFGNDENSSCVATIESKFLAEENIRLKKIIADLALSLELKDEELRMLHSRNRRQS